MGLFRSEVKSSLKTDLVVLVTPRVIETDGGLLGWESKAKTERRKWSLFGGEPKWQ